MSPLERSAPAQIAAPPPVLEPIATPVPAAPLDAVEPIKPGVDEGPVTAAATLPSVGRARNTRVRATIQDARASLVARREGYAKIIAQHEQTIAGLEQEIAAIDRRISQKTSDAQSLVQRKQRLISEITQNQKLATAAAAYGGLMGLFTFGASAVVGAGMAAAAGATVIKLQGDLKDANRQESDAERTLSDLMAVTQAQAKIKAELGTSLGALKAEHDALAKEAPESLHGARAVLAELEAGAARDEKLIANLEAQIALLETAKARLGSLEKGLDATLTALKADVKALEAERDQSRRAIFTALLDIGLAAFGATAALKAQGLLKAEKEVLLGAADVLKGDLAGAAGRLLSKLIEKALVLATDEPAAAKLYGNLVKAAAHA
ncbi:MAG: hypothetical protein U1E65_18705 [Myxococcota bacterium]